MIDGDITVGTSESLEAGARTADLLRSFPSLRHALFRTLELCREPHSSAEIDGAVSGLIPGASVYNAAILREWLERAGGLERNAEADESTGTPEVPVSPSPGESSWRTTEAGVAVVTSMAPSRLTRALLEDEDAHYAHIHSIVLGFCAEEPRSTKEIDALLVDHPDLQKPRRYASYFTNKLGEVGAIEWNGKWSTTEIGRTAIQA